MQEIICTESLIAFANLQLEDSGSLQEGWACEIVDSGEEKWICFLHLPTQYFTLAGPFSDKGDINLRQMFASSLDKALETDGFEDYRISDITGRFRDMGLHSGPLSAQHLKILTSLTKSFLAYAKAVGPTLDADEFAVQIRNAPGVQLAAITPRNTFALWAESTSMDD
jgi:uncharacterized protein (DUF2237 family)